MRGGGGWGRKGEEEDERKEDFTDQTTFTVGRVRERETVPKGGKG